jgi:hypothetical protein
MIKTYILIMVILSNEIGHAANGSVAVTEFPTIEQCKSAGKEFVQMNTNRSLSFEFKCIEKFIWK